MCPCGVLMGSFYDKILYGNCLKEGWLITLIYTGENNANQSGVSDKFWEASHTAGSPTAIVRWGKRGTTGQSMSCHFDKTLTRAKAKLCEGYVEDPKKCKHWSAEDGLILLSPATIKEKLLSLPYPYNLTASVSFSDNLWRCLDEYGDVIVNLTRDGVRDLLAS